MLRIYSRILINLMKIFFFFFLLEVTATEVKEEIKPIKPIINARGMSSFFVCLYVFVDAVSLPK